MLIVLAETTNRVNTTTEQIERMRNLMLPHIDTKLS